MTELVEIAFAADEHQAAMIQALLEEHEVPSLQQQAAPSGPQVGYGALNPAGGPRRIMVHAHRAEEARALLNDVLAEAEAEVPEPVNAEYLEDGQGGRGPRNYGVIGAYARIFFWGFGGIGIAFGIFALLRVLGLT